MILYINIMKLKKKQLGNLMKPSWMMHSGIVTRATLFQCPWTELPDVAPNMVASVQPVKPSSSRHSRDEKPSTLMLIGSYRQGTMALVTQWICGYSTSFREFSKEEVSNSMPAASNFMIFCDKFVEYSWHVAIFFDESKWIPQANNSYRLSPTYAGVSENRVDCVYKQR